VRAVWLNDARHSAAGPPVSASHRPPRIPHVNGVGSRMPESTILAKCQALATDRFSPIMKRSDLAVRRAFQMVTRPRMSTTASGFPLGLKATAFVASPVETLC
jgi:hypothetical protein